MNPADAAWLLALLREPLDWAYLLRLAARHRLAPLLYWHLSRTSEGRGTDPGGRGSVPLLAEVRRCFEQTANRNLFLTSQLLELLDVLKTHGIEAIPFKGPVLATALYQNVALRPFDDLDLFVRKTDIPKVSALLMERGYQPLYRLTDTEAASYLESNCELCFVREAGRVYVDVHWGIAPEYFSVPFDPAQWWTRACAHLLGGKEVLTLSPEDLLLYLCIHGAKHSWERLLWLTDVTALLQAHPDLQYGPVFERAASLRSSRMLGLGLALAKDLLGAALPVSVEDRLLADRAIPALVARVREGIGQEESKSGNIFAMSRFRLKARERFVDRLTYCLKLATLPSIKDWAWVSLPRLLYPLYFILRPLRLGIQRGLGSLVHGVRRASTGRLASH
jgi:hypothetical protein